MIVVRNVFHLKFGKAREAMASMKEGMAIQKRLGLDAPHRILTDATGTFYTLILEFTLPNLAAIEPTFGRIMGDKEWHAHYEKFSALCDSGHREIYNVVE